MGCDQDVEKCVDNSANLVRAGALETVKEIMIKLLMAAGTVGLPARELCAGVRAIREGKGLDSYLSNLVAAGWVTKLGRSHEARYFATPEHAERGRKAWERWRDTRRKQMQEAMVEKRRLTAREAYADARRRAGKEARKVKEGRSQDDCNLANWKSQGKAARGHAPWGPDTPAVITAATKITICPSPPDPVRTNTHPRVW